MTPEEMYRSLARWERVERLLPYLVVVLTIVVVLVLIALR
jgi:t-SNARE complex subunit (syntaxin)